MAESVKASTDPKVAADVIAEEAYQRVKLTSGADGTATDVSTAAPLPVSDAGGSLTVDGTVTAAGALLEAIKTAVETLDNIVAGSEAQVDVLTLPALPAGTNAIGKLAANSGVDIGDVDVTSLTGGTVAHDEADSGKPIKVGAKGVTVLPTAVTTGDRTDALSDKFGRQLGTVAPLDQRVSGTTNFTTETAGDVIAAPGASTALVITGIKVVNNHATVKTKVEILNDATKIDLGSAAPNGGGWVISDPNGLFPPLTTNKALRAKCITTGADVDVTAYGYKVPA